MQIVSSKSWMRVFKIRGVRQLVTSLTSQDAVGRGDATNAIWNGGQFKEHERLYIEPRETKRLDPGAIPKSAKARNRDRSCGGGAAHAMGI